MKQLSILAISIFCLFSCNKEEVLTKAGHNVSKKYIDQLKNYYYSQKETLINSSLTENNVIGAHINDSIEWDKTLFFTEFKTFITPVYFEKFQKDSTFSLYKFLVIQQKEESLEGFFDYVFANNKTYTQALNENIAQNEILFGLNNKLNCEKNPSVFQIRYTIDYQKMIPVENCNWQHFLSFNKVEGVTNLLNSNTQNFYSISDCEMDGGTLVTIDWYWQVYENGVLVSETYLYSTQECVGGSGQPNPSPSTPTSTSSFCVMTVEEAQEALSNMTGFVNNFSGLNLNLGPVYGPDQNQIYRRAVNPRGSSYKLTILWSAFVEYQVFYTGVLFKEGVNGQWLWESFSYDKIMQIDGIAPPCISISASASVSTYISADKKIAYGSGTMIISPSISCLGGVQTGQKSGVVEDHMPSQYEYSY